MERGFLQEGPMRTVSVLGFDQIQNAMKAMIDEAMKTPLEPVAMAIVDDAGNLVAFAKMDNLRLYSRRHAIRKAYTAVVMGMDSVVHAEQLHGQGRSISETGDPNLTYAPGGIVIKVDEVIVGGIGVGGYTSGLRDQDLARVGLGAMNV
jgi:glc operon protein GlcG